MVTPRIDATELTQVANMIGELRQFYPTEQRELLINIGEEVSAQMHDTVTNFIFPGQRKPITDTGELANSIGYDIGQGKNGPTVEIGINPVVNQPSRADLRRQTIKEGPGLNPGSTAGLYWADVEFGQLLQPDAPAQEFLGWRNETVRERQPRGSQRPTEGQIPLHGAKAGPNAMSNPAQAAVSRRSKPVIRSYNASDTDWGSITEWAYRKFSHEVAPKILGSLRIKMDEGQPTNPQPFFSHFANVSREGAVTGLAPRTVSIIRDNFAEFVNNISRFQRRLKPTGTTRTYFAIRHKGQFSAAQGRIPDREVTGHSDWRTGAFRQSHGYAQVQRFVDDAHAEPWRSADAIRFGGQSVYPWSRHRPDLMQFQYNPFAMR